MKQVYKYLRGTGLFLLVLMAFAAARCSETGKDSSLKNALIWRITREDLPGPSYLFGTVHVVDSAQYPIHKTVMEQLKRSDALVFETDLTLVDYPRKALEYAMMAHDTLDGLMKKEQYESVRSFFMEEFHFPVEAVKRMKPFYLSSLIGSLQSSPGSTSHEQVLMEVARREGKAIRGISTLEKESELLDRIPLEEQIRYLLDEIETYRKGQSGLQQQEIMEAYQAAAISRIQTSIYESLCRYDSIYACMFTERNESWMPGMKRLMQKESCFFAVGAGHLAGESGLIRLLRKEGYKVKPVHLDFWFHD